MACEIISRFDGDITLLSIPPVGGWRRTLNADIAATNSLLQTACEGSGTFVDLWPALAINGELNAAYTEDGLHLDADGYQALFNQLQ